MGKFFYYRSIQKFINVFLVVLVVILFGSCATNPNNPGKPYPNRPPLTALANVPPPTIVYEFGTAKVSLSWNGTDPDGFVTAYHFRWVTYQPSETSATSWRTILNTSFSGLLHRTFVPEVQEISHNASSVPNIYHYLSTLTGSSADSVITLLDSGKTLFLFGDSVSMANVKEFQNSNKGTFIFDSRDSSNIHEFQIKAVDNKGIESISPAAVRFGTPQIFPPDTRVNSTSAVTVSTVDSSHVDSLGHTIYDRLTRRYERTIHPMLPYLTATYLGLPFAYVGSDSLSPELMFQWNVDGKFQGNPGWSPYSMQTDALITALACDSLNNGWFDTTRYHYFTVRAKSQFELVDPTPDTILDSPVRCFDKSAEAKMIAEIEAAAKDGDSLGGVVEVLAYGMPVGLGSHVHWDRKIDGMLAQAIMSIQAVKGVEIGDGFAGAARRGSEAHDAISWDETSGAYRRESTKAGGTEGGMTTGELLVVRAAMKPLSTLNRPTLKTVDVVSKEETVSFKERTDVTAVPAMGVVAETMVALVLAAEAQRKFGGDSVAEFVRNARSFAESLRK